ncbi:hypothetical protein RSAG8_09749, partial [Rhizoctonia solani AG-8 WAC10335]
MPQEALSRSLLYLFDLMTEEEQSAFQCPPWTLPVWRDCFGLVPLGDSVACADDLVDLDNDSSTQPPAKAEDGFIFSAAALKTLTGPALHLASNQYTIRRAGDFMERFWKQWVQAAGKGQKIGRVISLVTPDTARALKSDDTGYREYRELLLAVFGRAGGVNSIVDEVMGAFRATPAEKWKDERNTNRGCPPRKRVAEHLVPIPPASRAIDSRVEIALARRLFGDAAVDVGGGLVKEWHPTVNCFLLRRYENLARRLETRKAKSGQAMAKFDDCLKAACAQQTGLTFRAATQALVAWRKIAVETLETDDAPFLERDKQMADLWAEAGFEFGEKVKRKGRVTKSKNTSTIPTEAEIEAAFQYYIEDYCNGIEAIDDLPTPGMRGPAVVQDLIDEETDIGVHDFKDWAVERVWQYLGLAGTRQFPFAEPGTTHAPHLKLPDKPGVFPLFHQVVGACVIILAAFTEELGQRARPSLLCDDVGLGKTIQLIGVISIIKHYFEQQQLEESKRLPQPEFSIAKNTLYFAGLKFIPNLPSIVISPRALSTQWVEQVAKFTQQGNFSIVRYSVDQGPLETFCTNPQGAYRIAAGLDGARASSVIIIADLSAISKEAKRCLEPPESFYKGNAARLWEAKGEAAEFKEGISSVGSILSMPFRVAAIDEIHLIRNCNATQRGVQLIAENSHLVVGASATPLITRAPDLGSIARVLRFQSLLGEHGVEYHKQMEKSRKIREKDWDTQSANIIMNTAFEEAKQAAGEDFSPDSELFLQHYVEAQKKYNNKREKSALKMSYVSQPAIDILREVLRPIVIRRTAISKDCDGKPILALPPLRHIVAWSRMKEHERIQMDKVNESHERWKEILAKKAAELGEDSPEILRWRNFLLDQKHCSMHPDILDVREREREQGLKEGDLLHTIVADWDESNIDQKASSRMGTVELIVNHYWSGNPKILVFNEDGSKNVNAKVDDPSPSQEPRKFLIYVSLSYHRKLFAKMFDIKKRGYVSYDGSMTPQKRQQALDKFTTDVNCRIMLISNVGSAGLNLTMASIVILVSPVWSGQETWQIEGRCHRLGQERDVTSYQIVAPEGIDLALMGYASGKTLTSERFMMSNNQLQRIYQGVTAAASEPEDDEDAEQQSAVVSTKGSKVASRKRKELPTEPAERDARDEKAGELGSSRPVKRSKPAATSSSQVATTSAIPAKGIMPVTMATKPVSGSHQESAAVPSERKTQKRAQVSSDTGRSPNSMAVDAPGDAAGKITAPAKGDAVSAALNNSQVKLPSSGQPRPRPKALPAATPEQHHTKDIPDHGVAIAEQDRDQSRRPTATKPPMKAAQPPLLAKRAGPSRGPTAGSHGNAGQGSAASAARDSTVTTSAGRAQVASGGLPQPQPHTSQMVAPARRGPKPGAQSIEQGLIKGGNPPAHADPADPPVPVIASSSLRAPQAQAQNTSTRAKVKFRAPRVMGARSAPVPPPGKGPDTMPLPTPQAQVVGVKAIRLPAAVASQNGEILSPDGYYYDDDVDVVN